MKDSVQSTALAMGPLAVLSFASLVSHNPILALVASFGPNILAPHLDSAWSRCCRNFLSAEELKTEPLQSALLLAVNCSIDEVRSKWEATPAGHREVVKAINFNNSDVQATKHMFDDLRRKLRNAAAAENLKLFTSPDIALDLGADEAATSEIFRKFLERNGIFPATHGSLARFVASNLPPALARAFDVETRTADARAALDHIVQRYQASILRDLQVGDQERLEWQRTTDVQLSAIRDGQHDELEKTVGKLQEVLDQGGTFLDGLRDLADQFQQVQAGKVRIVAAADLNDDITGPRVDIPIAKQPAQELRLPFDEKASRIFNENHVLVIKGKPSSGKTHLAGKLLRQLTHSLVVIPRSYTDVPPPFTGLRGRSTILFLDDLHDRAEKFDPTPWWAALEDACGPESTRLLITARGGDHWENVMEKQPAFIRSLPINSVFEIPEMDRSIGREFGQTLGLDDKEIARFDGTIGSLVLDFSKMGEEYKHLTKITENGVHASRLLDAAKLLHGVRQPSLREDVLKRVCELVMGDGKKIASENWRFLKEKVVAHGFGGFDEKMFVTYAPYLEHSDVIKFDPTREDVAKAAQVLFEDADAESLFYLGVSCHFDWKDHELTKAAYQHGIALGDGVAAFNLGVLCKDGGDLPGAKEAYRQGISLGNGAAAFNLGLLLEDEQDQDGAKDAYRQGVALRHGSAAFNLGLLLENEKDRKGAKEAYRHGMDLGDGAAASNLGVLLMEEGEAKGAKKAYRRAIALGHGEAAYNLGVLLREEGDWNGSRSAFELAKNLGFVPSPALKGRVRSISSSRNQ